MNSYLKIFNPHEHMEFEGIISQTKKNALMVPIMIAYTLLTATLLFGIGVIDYEIYYKIFDYLSGDNNYWSPNLMAFTGIIMMTAFHILANNKPDHVIVRVVSALTGLIIMAFIIGGGLYISQMLYNDGMGEPTSDIPMIIGEDVESEIKQNWVDALFENFTSPLAVLTLSLGIGGLSIVALYIAHHLLHVIEKNISEIYTRLSTLRTVLVLHWVINQSETKMANLKSQDCDLSFQGEQYWKQQIGEEVLEVISQELLPHEQTLQEEVIFEPKHRWEQDKSEDIRKITTMIKKIKSITLSDILKVMSLPKTLRK